ncbi:MAG: glycerol dehydrogenase [Methanomassiliicoccales archaeon]
MMNREVAWRVFAGEFNSSRLEIKGEGDKAPSHLITPLGAVMNRVFIVGVLTDIDNIGGEQEPLWRARVSDPTGTFYVSSGQYQPEATAVLSKLQPPKFVAMVGKVRTYSPEEGTMYVSVRPERIAEVDLSVRDQWVLETCKSTLARIAAVEEAQSMSAPTAAELEKLGVSPILADGVLKAQAHYGTVELARYKAMVLDAVKFLMPDQRMAPDMPEDAPMGAEELDDEPEEASDVDKEKLVLELIEKLDKNNKGATYDDIVAAAKGMGIEKDELNEVTNLLLDKGMVYEPVLGKIRIA